MLRLLYLITGEMSFDEMFLLDVFINQLPEAETRHLILSPALPVSHINMKDNISFEVAEANFGQSDWQALLASQDFDLVVLGDPNILGYNEPQLSYFRPEWLSELTVPLAVLDYSRKMARGEDGRVVFSKKLPQEGGLALEADYIIRVCPPAAAPAQTLPGEFYWRNRELMPMLSAYATREMIRQELNCAENTRIVTLLFPMESVLMMGQQRLFMHAPSVLETVIYYLNQLPDPFQLFVVNMDNVLGGTQFDNVTVRFFTSLQLETFDRLLKTSDLFLTESLTHPSLIQAALQGIPAVVLASSVACQEGQLTMAFAETTPFIQLKLDMLRAQQPELLFPYTSFPVRSRQWPHYLGLVQTEHYLLYLADLFDEKETQPLLQQLLTESDEKQRFREALEEYSHKIQYAADSESIVNAILAAAS